MTLGSFSLVWFNVKQEAAPELKDSNQIFQWIFISVLPSFLHMYIRSINSCTICVVSSSICLYFDKMLSAQLLSFSFSRSFSRSRLFVSIASDVSVFISESLLLNSANCSAEITPSALSLYRLNCLSLFLSSFISREDIFLSSSSFFVFLCCWSTILSLS